MKCPICGAAELIHDTRDISYTYKGESTMIPMVIGDFCLACSEGVLDMSEGKRVSNLMLEFKKQVNAAIIDPGRS
jgi:HTH-type transcriptional regulator/antitoxin MqsA